jgi:hypothetical protein
MSTPSQRPIRLLILAAVIAIAPLAACRKSETPSAAGTSPGAGPAASPAAGPAAPAAPATGVAPLKVVSLTFGKSVGADNRVSTEADTFAPIDTVYAVVGTSGASTGSKLTARWSSVSRSGAENQVHEESKTITPAGDAATEFHIAPASGLTPGDYKVEILLDDKSVAVKAFRVAK